MGRPAEHGRKKSQFRNRSRIPLVSGVRSCRDLIRNCVECVWDRPFNGHCPPLEAGCPRGGCTFPLAGFSGLCGVGFCRCPEKLQQIPRQGSGAAQPWLVKAGRGYEVGRKLGRPCLVAWSQRWDWPFTPERWAGAFGLTPVSSDIFYTWYNPTQLGRSMFLVSLLPSS